MGLPSRLSGPQLRLHPLSRHAPSPGGQLMFQDALGAWRMTPWQAMSVEIRKAERASRVLAGGGDVRVDAEQVRACCIAVFV